MRQRKLKSLRGRSFYLFYFVLMFYLTFYLFFWSFIVVNVGYVAKTLVHDFHNYFVVMDLF